jgi:hypothetical protein
MTEQKKSASPDSLTEAGKGAKVELTEAQLKDVAGGAIDSYRFKMTSSSTPAEAASLNFALKI